MNSQNRPTPNTHSLSESFHLLIHFLEELLIEVTDPYLEPETIRWAQSISKKAQEHSHINWSEIPSYSKHEAVRLTTILLELSRMSYQIAQLKSKSTTLRPIHKPKDSATKKIIIDLVLTAHPTQVKRTTLVNNYSQIFESLFNIQNISQDNLEKSKPHILKNLKAIWLTRHLKDEKPHPIFEARNGSSIAILNLWKSLHKLYNKLDPEFNEIRFSTWMGGDRDGNPFVTTPITFAIFEQYKEVAKEQHLDGLKQLIQDLSFSKASTKLLELSQNPEPYREVLKKCENLIINPTENSEKTKTLIIKNIEVLAESLGFINALDHKQDLENWLHSFKCFGLELFKMDFRQDTLVIRDLIELVFEVFIKEKTDSSLKTQLLSKEAHSDSFKLKQDFLIWIQDPQITEKLQPQTQDTLDLLLNLNKIPENSRPYFIMSMCESLSDWLSLEWIFWFLDIKTTQAVPLFETIEDLKKGPGILNEYIEHKKLISNNTHTASSPIMVMLGYSDSSKSGSSWSSLWTLDKAQIEMQKVASSQNVELLFFHGRGGSLARGQLGIKTSIESLPPQSENIYRLTVQGETIHSQMGTPSLAAESLQRYLESFREKLFPQKNNVVIPETLKQLLYKSGDKSYQYYTRYIENPEFFKLFLEKTPINHLAKLNIGSRPAKRRTSLKIGVDSFRAIPWNFAWAQSRLFLPSWFGLGQGLEYLYSHALQNKQIGTILQSESLQNILSKYEVDLYRVSWDYFKSDHPLLDDFKNEFELAKKYLLLLKNQKKLLQNQPEIQSILDFQMNYVNVLSSIQSELLEQKVFNNDKLLIEQETLKLSFLGISSGLGFSG